MNLGVELRLEVAAEPLLAPPAEERRWQVLWSSEDPRYGGQRHGRARDRGRTTGGWPATRPSCMAPAPAEDDEYRNPPGNGLSARARRLVCDVQQRTLDGQDRD